MTTAPTTGPKPKALPDRPLRGLTILLALLGSAFCIHTFVMAPVTLLLLVPFTPWQVHMRGSAEQQQHALRILFAQGVLYFNFTYALPSLFARFHFSYCSRRLLRWWSSAAAGQWLGFGAWLLEAVGGVRVVVTGG